MLSELAVDDSAIRTIELNPASSSRDKLRVARAHSFNRASFGVQTLTRDVLAAHHRGHQRTSSVAQAIRAAWEESFEHVNVDLLWLPGERLDTWRSCVSEVLALRPSGVTFYRLQPGGSEPIEEPVRAAWEVYRAECERAGFVVVQEYAPTTPAFAAYDERRPLPRLTYTPHPSDGSSVLGLGPGARSVCRGQLHYSNRVDGTGETGFAPCYFGTRRSLDDERRAALIQALAHQPPLVPDRFARLFRVDPLEAYRGELELLQQLGYAEREADSVRLTVEDSTELAAVSLILAGEERVAWLEASLDARAEARAAPPATARHPWLPAGAVAETGWTVAGRDRHHPDWTRLEDNDGAVVLFELRPARDGDDPRICRGGWYLAYRGQSLPMSAREALEALRHQARATGG